MGPVEAKILGFLAEREGARYSEIKRGVGAADKVVWELLLKLEEKGYVKKINRGVYKITEEGRKAYEEVKKMEAAERAVSINKVIEALKRRMEKTMPYLEPFLTNDKFEALMKLYGIALTLGFYKPSGGRAAELINQLTSSFKTVALYPPPEGEEEEEAFFEALLTFLSHLIKCRSFREKIAKGKKLSFILDVDFSDTQLTEEELRISLFFSLAYQGLRREGKV